jgi:hypothetical protein
VIAFGDAISGESMPRPLDATSVICDVRVGS